MTSEEKHGIPSQRSTSHALKACKENNPNKQRRTNQVRNKEHASTHFNQIKDDVTKSKKALLTTHLKFRLEIFNKIKF